MDWTYVVFSAHMVIAVILVISHTLYVASEKTWNFQRTMTLRPHHHLGISLDLSICAVSAPCYLASYWSRAERSTACAVHRISSRLTLSTIILRHPASHNVRQWSPHAGKTVH